VSDRLSPHQLRIVPLGGLGEIGMNCLALEHDDSILVIDCGTNLPRDDLGVDVIHPDFTWLVERGKRVRGVFLTHGHEDHIGGLPYLLAMLPVPVWGPPYALGLVRRRLREHRFDLDSIDLRPAAAGFEHRVGSFGVTPLHVSHSIVDASALCVETNAGTVVHTGDFNLETEPPDGIPTDLRALAQLGDRGVRLLMSDSTNVDLDDRTGSEREVAEHLRELVLPASGRMFVSMFASNLHRLSALGRIARECGRQICLLGRSMNAQVEVATELGRLDWPSDLLVAPDAARDLPRHRLLVLAGGSQAEPDSALCRLAKNAHHHLEVDDGDTVILSSRVIPGNERAVVDMLCALMRLGATVHSAVSDPGVHTSGHAGRTELLRMLEVVRPVSFLPVHGTLHHLRRHAELGRAAGVADVMVVENGASLILDEQGLRSGGRVPHGRVAIDDGGEPLGMETLHQRSELGRSGIVAVSLAVDSGGRLLAEPRVTALGVPAVDGQALELVAHDVRRALRRLRRTDPATAGFTEQLRRTVRRRILDLASARPTIEIHLLLAENEFDRC
jgi:ribonuclease J